MPPKENDNLEEKEQGRTLSLEERQMERADFPKRRKAGRLLYLKEIHLERDR